MRGLSARYGRIEVCRGIDLAVDAGELLLLLGPNGAGKSSLLGALSGSVSSSGEVTVSERPLHGRSAARRARLGVSLVPEGRRNIFGPLSVMENLQLGLRLLPAAQRDDMTKWLLGLFPVLRERRRQQASLLSGGEQQMLAIAMAVARRPAVLLLDEPSQGLAPVVLEQLAEAIGVLRPLGLMIVLAEQNVSFASRLADHFVVLQGGEVRARGGKAELADRPALARAMMG
ncbi:MAG: ATP-binding cassette domain-containing protein [Alphaproteobacteria bacterium]|nr:ATP-binding cassette domain-containing protein [Alphaproteobacteria bacterium]